MSRQSAIYRAKEGYFLWLRRAVKVEGFCLHEKGYSFHDKIEDITVILKMNGSLACTFCGKVKQEDGKWVLDHKYSEKRI